MDGLQMKEKVLDLLKMKGPQLPVQVATQLKISSTFSGAFLSELIADGKVKYSNLKIGGSPIYYAVGHEIKLQSFTKHLGQREKEAYEILSSEKIVKHETLTPVIRIAMASIKDFAIPIKVTVNDDTNLYWKWYLLTEQEMHEIIEKKLGFNKEPVKEEKKELIEEKLNNLSSQSQLQNLPKTQSNNLESTSPPILFTPEKKAEKRKSGAKSESSLVKGPIPQSPHQTPLSAIPKEAKPTSQQQIENSIPTFNGISNPQINQTFPQNNQPIIANDPFAKSLSDYFASKGIKVLSSSLMKKNAEADLILEMPTPLGNVSYFCTAKKKKKCNEADVSAGYVKANTKGLPYVFISTGEMPRKVKEFIATHMPQALIITLEFKP